MSSKELYRRFVNLCQKWPKDETKPGRDYAEFFRQILAEQFPHGELGDVKDKRFVESALDSLESIAKDDKPYSNVVKRSSSTGLEAWATTLAVSTENMKELQRQDESILVKRLRGKLSIKFDESKEKD